MLCVALRGGSSPNWLQCDPSAWGGPQVCVAIVRAVAAPADLRVLTPPRGKIPPGPQRGSSATGRTMSLAAEKRTWSLNLITSFLFMSPGVGGSRPTPVGLWGREPPGRNSIDNKMEYKLRA
jgi:hypothetical protein